MGLLTLTLMSALVMLASSSVLPPLSSISAALDSALSTLDASGDVACVTVATHGGGGGNSGQVSRSTAAAYVSQWISSHYEATNDDETNLTIIDSTSIMEEDARKTDIKAMHAVMKTSMSFFSLDDFDASLDAFPSCGHFLLVLLEPLESTTVDLLPVNAFYATLILPIIYNSSDNGGIFRAFGVADLPNQILLTIREQGLGDVLMSFLLLFLFPDVSSKLIFFFS